MYFKIIFRLVLITIVVNASTSSPTTTTSFAACTAILSSEITSKLTVDYENCIWDKCNRDYPLTAEMYSELEHWEIPDDKNVRNNLLCLLKGFGIYSRSTGLNATEFAREIFNEDHHNQTIIEPIAKTCTDKLKQEPEEDIMIYKVLKCTIDGIGKDELKKHLWD